MLAASEALILCRGWLYAVGLHYGAIGLVYAVIPVIYGNKDVLIAVILSLITSSNLTKVKPFF
jgi:hypothetical protein